MAYSSMTVIAAVVAYNIDTLPSNLSPLVCSRYHVTFKLCKKKVFTQRLFRKQPYYK
jgi:hypothetical protein